MCTWNNTTLPTWTSICSFSPSCIVPTRCSPPQVNQSFLFCAWFLWSNQTALWQFMSSDEGKTGSSNMKLCFYSSSLFENWIMELCQMSFNNWSVVDYMWRPCSVQVLLKNSLYCLPSYCKIVVLMPGQSQDVNHDACISIACKPSSMVELRGRDHQVIHDLGVVAGKIGSFKMWCSEGLWLFDFSCHSCWQHFEHYSVQDAVVLKGLAQKGLVDIAIYIVWMIENVWYLRSSSMVCIAATH